MPGPVARGCITWRVLGVAKEAAAGRHWKWQSFLRPTLLVEVELQLLLLLWLAACPQPVITILGFFMLLITVMVVGNARDPCSRLSLPREATLVLRARAVTC